MSKRLHIKKISDIVKYKCDSNFNPHPYLLIEYPLNGYSIWIWIKCWNNRRPIIIGQSSVLDKIS